MPDSIVYTPTARNAVQVLKATDDALTVGGHLVVFDDPASPQKDLAGDYFTRDTDFGPARELKVTGQLFHHGMPLKDGSVFDAPLPLLKMSEDEIGIFVETTYDMANEYHRAVGTAIKNSIEKGAPFGWSSSTAFQTFKRADDGRILKWWLIEGSPTPTPCEPRTALGTSVMGKAIELSKLVAQPLAKQNLTARISAVYDAFYRMVDAAGDWDSYVAEVWDEYLVVRVSSVVAQGYYRAAYSFENGAAAIAPPAEWEQVEPAMSSEWETVKAMYEAHTSKSASDFDPWLLALSMKLQNQNMAINLRTHA